MSFTNSTPNYGLPQYIGTDKPTYLGDMNTAYSTIDTQMKANADAAAAATSTANTAASTATAASTNATTALNTANSAASEAASATSAAASATSTANNAATNASAALRASAANTIENLAPAYDPTLTYSVGDLVTYIDENNSGKLYKCIVAVAAPEAFNINKWDDVTTSEAYAGKAVHVGHFVFDGTNTLGDLLEWLRDLPWSENILSATMINKFTATADYMKIEQLDPVDKHLNFTAITTDALGDTTLHTAYTKLSGDVKVWVDTKLSNGVNPVVTNSTSYTPASGATSDVYLTYK